MLNTVIGGLVGVVLGILIVSLVSFTGEIVERNTRYSSLGFTALSLGIITIVLLIVGFKFVW